MLFIFSNYETGLKKIGWGQGHFKSPSEMGRVRGCGGLESIVQLGDETVLGNDSMGEYETTDMFIVWN